MTVRTDGESAVVESNGGRCDVSLDGSVPHGRSVPSTGIATPTISKISLNKGGIQTTTFETPTRHNPSKFVFLSDRKSVPTEIKNLQERTIKRRRDFLAQIHEMVCAPMAVNGPK